MGKHLLAIHSVTHSSRCFLNHILRDTAVQNISAQLHACSWTPLCKCTSSSTCNMTCPCSRLFFSYCSFTPSSTPHSQTIGCVTGFRPFTSLGAWWCTGTETAFSTILFSHTSHQHVAINCDVVPWSLILMSRDGNNTRLRRKRQWLQIVFNNTLNNRLRTVAPSAEQVGI